MGRLAGRPAERATVTASTSSFQRLLVNFSPLLTSPSFGTFSAVVLGWVLCAGRHSISHVIQYAWVLGNRKHHSAYYRFFSSARWSVDTLCEVILGLVKTLIPGPEILLLIDDTLCRRSGPHVWGAAMHHDALSSNYGRGSCRKVAFACGLNWVIASVWVPLPWQPGCGIAVPILFRLYRSKKRCSEGQYRKRTELAHEMLQVILSWLPEGKRLCVAGDSEYSCRNVVRGLPECVTFVGRMPMDANVHAQPGPYKGRGRPPAKGERLPSPAKLAADDSISWENCEVHIYGRVVRMLVKSQVCLWTHVVGTRRVRMVVTRDPKGRIEDRAYFSTHHEMSIEDVVIRFSRRWPAEVMHRNAKQLLGLTDPQNGWWRNPRGKRRNHHLAGPQPHQTRGEQAVLRTTPLVLITYALVVLWYLRSGNPAADVAAARRRTPWYRHKTCPSFADMLAAVRRDILADTLFGEPGPEPGSPKREHALAELLMAA